MSAALQQAREAASQAELVRLRHLLTQAEEDRDTAKARRDAARAELTAIEAETARLRRAARVLPPGCALVLRPCDVFDLERGRLIAVSEGAVLVPPSVDYRQVDESFCGCAIPISHADFQSLLASHHAEVIP